MGSFFLYYFFIYPISCLPLYVNQRLAYVMYLILYYGVRYRRKVVFQNIQSSFPEKTEEEVHAMSKEFYKHLCLLVGESVKNFTVSEKYARKRLQVENFELLDAYHAKGQSILSVGGHYGNWEVYALLASKFTKLRTVALYTPIKDVFFDKKMRETRSRFGTEMIPMRQVSRYIKENITKTPFSLVFAADQWPPNTKKAHWVPFLGRETPFYTGIEKIARKHNLPVVYGEIIKVKKGHYKVVAHEITNDPSTLPEGEIIRRYAALLEQTIKTHNPSHWLWSHKRWKRTKAEVFNS